MDIGKVAYKVLTNLDEDTEHLSVFITIDLHQALLDVEWIEDRMEEIVG